MIQILLLKRQQENKLVNLESKVNKLETNKK